MLRSFLRAPRLPLLIVLVLALGIAAAVYMLGLLEALHLKGLPFDEGRQLVHLEYNDTVRGRRFLDVDAHDFQVWREQPASFEGLAAYRRAAFNLSDGERAERFAGAFVSPATFSLLRVEPALGRGFAATDEAPGGPAKVILGHALWRDRHGADPAILGRQIRVNGEPATVVGVMPEGFEYPIQERLWLPLRLDPAAAPGDGELLDVMGRLKAGITLAEARAEMALVIGRLRDEHPLSHEGLEIVVQPYTEQFLLRSNVAILYVMLALGLLVLLIAGASASRLWFARLNGRARELAFRVMLGARRGQILRGLVAEMLVLAFVAGGVGFALAAAGLALTEPTALSISGSPPFWWDFSLDARLVAGATLITLLAALAAGLVPAVHVARRVATEKFWARQARDPGFYMGRLSRASIAVELAFSMILLAAASTMARSAHAIYNLDLGADAAGFIAGRITLPAGYGTAASRRTYFENLQRDLAQAPEVEAAVVATSLPGLFARGDVWVAHGADLGDPASYRNADVLRVGEGYFEAFAISPIYGRLFDVRDREDGLPVVAVSEVLATRQWGERDPVGKRIRLGGAESEGPWLTVVGVVPHVVHGLVKEESRADVVYLPLAQSPPREARVAVRGRDRKSVARAMREAVAAADPDTPVYAVSPLLEVIDQQRAGVALGRGLLGIFALLGLVVACAGIHGLVSFFVARRTREIGIQRALGAHGRQIYSFTLRPVLLQIVLGLGLGTALGMSVANALGAGLFGVGQDNVPYVFATAVALAAAALAAAAFAARRALRLDPADALRME